MTFRATDTPKQETIDELIDTLDSLAEADARPMLNKLTYADLILLQAAIRVALTEEQQRTKEVLLGGEGLP